MMAGVDGWLPMWDMVDTVGVRLNQAEHDALVNRRLNLVSKVEYWTRNGHAPRPVDLAELSALNKVLG